MPAPTGSVVDLTVEMAKPVTKDEVNAAMKEAAAGPLKGILKYTEDPIVSSDIIGDPHSSIFTGDLTMVMGDNLLKMVSWYDNEWGYSCRSADLIEQHRQDVVVRRNRDFLSTASGLGVRRRWRWCGAGM